MAGSSIADREKRVELFLSWIAEGKSYAEIANILMIVRAGNVAHTALDLAFARASEQYTKRVYAVLFANGYEPCHRYAMRSTTAVHSYVHYTETSFEWTLKVVPRVANGAIRSQAFNADMTDAQIMATVRALRTQCESSA